MFEGKEEIVFDIETDGFNATKIWCATVNNLTTGSKYTMVDVERMKEYFSNPNLVLIVHNGESFDKPTLERLLGIKIEATLIDTLGLSWYLYPTRQLHGLAAWGEDFGVPKPTVLEEEWKGLPQEELEIIKYYEENN